MFGHAIGARRPEWVGLVGRETLLLAVNGAARRGEEEDLDPGAYGSVGDPHRAFDVDARVKSGIGN